MMNVKVSCIINLVLVLMIVIELSHGYPSGELEIENLDLSRNSRHHHHHKHHHIRHKHHRRSLSSKEESKTQRNKQIMLTKPYWPWP